MAEAFYSLSASRGFVVRKQEMPQTDFRLRHFPLTKLKLFRPLCTCGRLPSRPGYDVLLYSYLRLRALLLQGRDQFGATAFAYLDVP